LKHAPPHQPPMMVMVNLQQIAINTNNTAIPFPSKNRTAFKPRINWINYELVVAAGNDCHSMCGEEGMMVQRKLEYKLHAHQLCFNVGRRRM
jgi:hypothetical protein